MSKFLFKMRNRFSWFESLPEKAPYYVTRVSGRVSKPGKNGTIYRVASLLKERAKFCEICKTENLELVVLHEFCREGRIHHINKYRGEPSATELLIEIEMTILQIVFPFKEFKNLIIYLRINPNEFSSQRANKHSNRYRREPPA